MREALLDLLTSVLHSLLDVLPVGAVVVEPCSLRIAYVNPRAAAAFRVGDAPFAPGEPALARALAGEVLDEVEIALAGARGPGLLASAVPLRDQAGVVTGALLTFKHVGDEAEAAERALRDSTERLRLALQAASVGLWEREMPRGRARWSPEIERIFGLPPGSDDGTYETYLTRVHPDDRDDVDAALARALDTGEYRAEYRVLRPDGSVGWVQSLGRLVREPHGRSARLIGAVLDVTERKRADEQRAALLARAETARVAAERALTMFERLLQVTDTALAQQTLDDLLYELLRRVCAVLDCDTATVLLVDHAGTHLVPVASSGLREKVTERVPIPIGEGFAGRIAAAGEPIAVGDLSRIGVVSEFLREHVTSVIGAPLTADDRVIGVLHAGSIERREFTDADLELLKRVAFRAAVAIERARLFDAEHEARAMAEAANRAKDDFLAIVSHELRTPLTAMLGWIRLLRSGRLSTAQTDQALDAIERNTRAQAAIISDLLDISRIASGKLNLDEHRVELGGVVAEAIESLAGQAEAKGVTVETLFNPAAGAVWGDAARLRQVVVNLLSNAIKFTPAGGRVRVLLEPAGARARIVVADSGPGIAPALLPHVFERFRQGESPSTRRHGGLGLGLAIARELVERHRGTIRAESEGAGRGATFVVELPVVLAPGRQAATAEPRVPAQRGPELGGVRVLEVDDHLDTRVMVRTALEQYGATVYVAGSADDAMAALAAHEVDVVVSDIAMPGGDGYALIERIRREHGARRLSVIALTAYASQAEHEAIVRAGFQLHLRKPIDPLQLGYAIEVLGRHARGADAALETERSS